MTQPSKIVFADFVVIDSTSPSGLRWSHTELPYRIQGEIAGYLVYRNSKRENRIPKFWKTSIQGLRYFNARIIWEITYGEIPDDFTIDHIDGDVSNNSIKNLRMVHQAVNKRNCKLNSNNTSGKKGVYLINDIYKGVTKQRYCAMWLTLDHLQRTKSFSVSKYGEAEAFRLAVEYRDVKLRS